ncbi:MAG: adenylate/guanylate cyclase domain-containing protein, partial [Gammaproteobacteria bacterium]
YAGMFGQIVPVTAVSAELVELTEGLGLVPFILYDGDRVLAHPAIAAAGSSASEDTSLQRLDVFGDRVLERIWTPDESELFFFAGMDSASAVTAEVDGRWYAFLYRTLTRFGPRPWTIGVYLDLDAEEDSVVDRLFYALAAGLVVLLVSVAVALWFARLLSRPVRALAAVAGRVGAGELDDVALLAPSRVQEIDQATRSINAMVEGLRERQTIRATLGRYVPEPVARELLSHHGELAVQDAEATVVFCDLRDFTALTEIMGAQGIVGLLNEYFTLMVEIIERHGGIVTQFQGDAVLAIFNVPTPVEEHAQRAVEAAWAMLEAVRERTFAGHEVGIRIGISSGRVVAGAVGAEGRLSYTVHGDAVNLAARLEALNKQYETDILVSGSTAGFVDGFEFRCVGEIAVRGQSVPAEIFSVSRAAAGASGAAAD